MKTTLMTLFIVFSTALFAGAQNLSVETIQFGTDVENRNIVNVDSVFTNSVERVYCFTQIDGADSSATVTHVWYHKNNEMARVELPVNGPNWRTWSSKSILESWTGEWSVDVLNSEGDVLATKTFRVESAVADQ